jgi:anti-sigma factor RsiW
VTPEDIDRTLASDAARVRASPRFAAAVMAAVRREAKTPPPLPFPWTRAAPGIAAVVLVFLLAVSSLVSTPGAETVTLAPPALERAVEISARVSYSLATLDARSASIWVIVAALTVVPILAPLLMVRVPERNS